MDKAEWKDTLFGLVAKRQYVSFAEIAGLEGAKGQSVLHLPGKANVIVWQGVNPVLAEAVTDMVSNRQVFLHPTDLMLYLADRQVLDLPVTRTLDVPPDAPLCWLPVVLCTFQHDAESEIGSIQKRLEEVSDWVRGRSSHTYQNDNAHASALARSYERDVRFLLGFLTRLRERLDEANGGTQGKS